MPTEALKPDNPILSDEIQAISDWLRSGPRPLSEASIGAYATKVRSLLQGGATPFEPNSFEAVMEAKGVSGSSKYVYRSAWRRYCEAMGTSDLLPPPTHGRPSPGPLTKIDAVEGPASTVTPAVVAVLRRLIQAGLAPQEIIGLRWNQLAKVVVVDGVLHATWRVPPNTYSKRLRDEFIAHPASDAAVLLRWAHGVDDTTELPDDDVLVVPLGVGQLQRLTKQ